MQKHTISTLKLFLYFCKGRHLQLFVLLALNLMLATSEALVVAALYPLSQALTGQESKVSLSNFNLLLYRVVDLFPGTNELVRAASFMMTVYMLKSILGFLIETHSAKLSAKLVVDLKSRIFTKILQAPYSFFLESKSGALSYQTLTSPHKPGLLLLSGLQALVEAFRFLGMSAVIFLMHWKITAMMFALGGLFSVLNSWVNKKILYPTGRKRIEAGSAQSIVVNECLAGIKYIQVFMAQNAWKYKFIEAAQSFKKNLLIENYWQAFLGRLFETIGIVGCCLLLIGVNYSDPRLIQDYLPSIAVFLFAFIRIIPVVSNFTRLRIQCVGALSESEPVFKFLEIPLGNEPAVKVSLAAQAKIEREIFFDKVSFKSGDHLILNQLSFKIPHQKVTAIVGASGAGKTTIINLLLGLLHPTSGSIWVDGQALNACDAQQWRKLIGYVGQDFFIFNGSILENILFDRPYAKEELEKAARLADAQAFIERLPMGYETRVGDRGVKLSGGQQQRLTITRALLKDPPLLIFDEATSALDNVSEANIHNMIQQTRNRKTVILIAHRLTSIKNADHILVLKEGELVETGDYASLVQQKGEFSKLYHESMK